MTPLYHWDVQRESLGSSSWKRGCQTPLLWCSLAYFSFLITMQVFMVRSSCTFLPFLNPQLLNCSCLSVAVSVPKVCYISTRFSPIIVVDIEFRELAIIGSPALFSLNRHCPNSYISAPLGVRCIFRKKKLMVTKSTCWFPLDLGIPDYWNHYTTYSDFLKVVIVVCLFTWMCVTYSFHLQQIFDYF